ncbi:hypothetical protein SD51_12190 [Alicyclobacillus tengchongensis]|nr:hypothetical protein SD51_12190 [Alicyclobacillus tengchongensis]
MGLKETIANMSPGQKVVLFGGGALVLFFGAQAIMNHLNGSSTSTTTTAATVPTTTTDASAQDLGNYVQGAVQSTADAFAQQSQQQFQALQQSLAAQNQALLQTLQAQQQQNNQSNQALAQTLQASEQAQQQQQQALLNSIQQQQQATMQTIASLIGRMGTSLQPIAATSAPSPVIQTQSQSLLQGTSSSSSGSSSSGLPSLAGIPTTGAPYFDENDIGSPSTLSGGNGIQGVPQSDWSYATQLQKAANLETPNANPNTFNVVQKGDSAIAQQDKQLLSGTLAAQLGAGVQAGQTVLGSMNGKAYWITKAPNGQVYASQVPVSTAPTSATAQQYQQAAGI